MRRLLTLVTLLLTAGLLVPAPAQADSRVGVRNSTGSAKIDPTYATTLTVRGTGFQSIRKGHGGIYVVFGTVSGTWRPSKGGVSGANLLYVPDSESKNNAGYQKYVAFPGSDTAASANGGTMSGNGSWSTTIVVPGATFQAYDRNGGSRTVDCRKVTCGVITIGAHGVTNARNETFTPVAVGDLQGAAPSSAPAADPGTTAPTADASAAAGVPAAATGPATLTVDRDSAKAGNVLPFVATGLPVGTQVSVVLDDGLAGAGPYVVGSGGQLSGVLSLPPDSAGGTHELRLFGVEAAPSVKFAIASAATHPTAAVDTVRTRPAAAGPNRHWSLWFAGAAAILLLGAVVRLVLLRRRGAPRAA